ncbi:MAG TPA: hypothetical protein VGO59_12905 [Verrucomicrobiae bacterium]
MKTHSKFNWIPQAAGAKAIGVAVALAGISVQAKSVYVGNSLTVPNGGSDGIPPFVILGEYNSAGPNSSSAIILPTGSVTDVKFYGGDYDFTLYALTPGVTGPNPNEQTFQVVASEMFSGSAAVGVQTLPVTGFNVTSGDLLAFAGTGPYYPQNANDAANSDATYADSPAAAFASATPPGGAGAAFSAGLNGDSTATFDYVGDDFGNQGRTYGIGVVVNTAVPDSAMTLLLMAPLSMLMAAAKRTLK